MGYKYRSSLDNGNSSAKARIRNENGVEKIHQKSLVKPFLTLPTFSETSLATAVANLYDNMIVHVTSPSVKLNGLYAVGEKARKLGKARNMNIHIGKKHTDDIPVIMGLSIIACKAVRDDFKEKEELSKEIDVEVEYSSALPATEFTPENAKFFEKRLLNGPHIVDVYATSHPVTVRITFKEVKVTQEGNPAVFAIVSGEESLLDDYNNIYSPAVNSDFQFEKILSIDIGDGTTELVYTVNGKPITEWCKGVRNGVGHAADEANKLLEENLSLELRMNRQEFMDAVLDESNKIHSDAQYAMSQATAIKSQELLDEIQDMYQDVLKGDVGVFAVFGGGAATFRSALYEDLLEYANANDVKLLWIPDKYAAFINVLGLDFLNEQLFFKK